jgi:3alpha(or 20beta)-hydroxysteroid dehydrogenase
MSPAATDGAAPFAGRVVIVTGAAGGQGRAEVERFAADGASVVATDIDETAGRRAYDGAGERIVFLRHDISDEGDWASVAATAESRWGGIDVLVNNGALYWQRSLEDESADGLRRMLDVNVVGAFLGMKAVTPAMVRRGGGSIVNISSTAGCAGFPHHAAYGASKWALRGLTRTAAVELGPHAIRVNCVVPGAVDTAMRPVTTAGASRSRVASPDEIASVVLFLAGPGSGAMSGADVPVDGGFLAGMGAPALIGKEQETVAATSAS